MPGGTIKFFEQISRAGVVFLLLGAVACVTPDRDRMKLGISPRAIHGTSATGMDTRLKSDPGVAGKATIYLPEEKDGFDAFISELSVDNEESALHHFQSRFLGVYLNLRNDSNVPIEFDARKLVLKTEHEDLSAVDNKNLPKVLNRINWKGNLKNAYNATVATVATVAIIASVMLCIDEGACDAVVRTTETAVKVGANFMDKSSKSGNENTVFSSITHDTQLIYNNLLPKQAVIQPGQNLEGLVFFPRPKDFTVARVFWKKEGVKEDDY